MVGVGASVLRSRVLRQRTPRTTTITTHARRTATHATRRTSLAARPVALGASAGLIPCPSALVVLLGAIAQDQVALGMLLIVAFSLGLAATLTGLGLAVVYARRRAPAAPCRARLTARCRPSRRSLIVVVGCVLTAHAVPQVA